MQKVTPVPTQQNLFIGLNIVVDVRLAFYISLMIMKNNKSVSNISDINECAVSNGGCQHQCHNTAGSYYCSCPTGFSLSEDEHFCKKDGCIREISAPNSVTSPNHPRFSSYKSVTGSLNATLERECSWNFVTKPGHRIKLVRIKETINNGAV